jgi:hypothetical protein
MDSFLSAENLDSKSAIQETLCPFNLHVRAEGKKKQDAEPRKAGTTTA